MEEIRKKRKDFFQKKYFLHKYSCFENIFLQKTKPKLALITSHKIYFNWSSVNFV